MSRIHEALKKAEEHLAQAGQTGAAWTRDSGGVGPAVSEEAAREVAGTLGRLELEDASTGDRWLRLDELRQRCTKPGWRFNPDYILTFEKQSFDQCAEQFRTLRSRLYRMQQQKQIRTLLITSTSAGEGKSFVSLNLARAIVRQHERRALLIDADLRASRLHVRMGAPSAPGLADYLRGETDEFSIIQAGVKEDLFFIPAGRPVSNPAELLASGHLKDLLHRLSPVFDWIVLDAPPVLAVSDASVLAGMCDGVVFVVRAGKTPHDAAQTACQELKENNLLGVVLNCADGKAMYGACSYYAGSGLDKE